MKRLIGLLGALALIAAPTTILAQDTEWNRYTLEDIGGVFVSAMADGSCESAGVTAATIQADAAIKLLDGDVDLLTQDQMLANPGLPELRIAVSCIDGGTDASGAFAYSVDVRVHQAAQMIRDNQVTLAEAVTWYTNAVGVVASASAESALKDAVGAKLTQFAEAYVAANATATGRD